jgi:rod shape determining protein RodA
MLSYLKKIDFGLLAPVAILATCSLLALSSIPGNYFWPQLSWLGVAGGVILVFSLINIRPFFKYRSAIFTVYITAIALLVLTLLVAPVIRGTRSWIPIGPAQLQTSELAKVALIITLSFYLARRHIGIARISTLLVPTLYAVFPIALVLMQPDMGTALVLLGVFVGFLFVSGLRPRHIAIGLVIAIVLSAWSWVGFLKPYQKDRVLGLIYPERDPLGVNYSVIQSKIAIGSAGFWGKGFNQGTQVQLGFLPEPQTDFIFSAFVEEWGLLGGLIIIFSFLALLLRIAFIGASAHDNFFKFVCLGAFIVFLVHFIFNIGSAVGLLPVVGVPFPFLSYGGSNILMSAILIGMISSLAIRNYF